MRGGGEHSQYHSYHVAYVLVTVRHYALITCDPDVPPYCLVEFRFHIVIEMREICIDSPCGLGPTLYFALLAIYVSYLACYLTHVLPGFSGLHLLPGDI